MKITIEFEEGDLNPLHDILYDLTGHEFTHNELLGFWKIIPQNIKNEAIHWGLDDTPTRDNIYVFFKNKLNENGIESWDNIETKIKEQNEK